MGLSTFSLWLSAAMTAAGTAGVGGLVSLGDGLDPLQARFNEQTSRPRLLAILSPT